MTPDAIRRSEMRWARRYGERRKREPDPIADAWTDLTARIRDLANTEPDLDALASFAPESNRRLHDEAVAAIGLMREWLVALDGAKPPPIRGGGWISRWIEEHYAQVAQQWAETPGASWGQMARACADAGLLHPGYGTMADYSAWRSAWFRVHRHRGGAKPDAAWQMAEEVMRQKGYETVSPPPEGPDVGRDGA